MTSSKQADATAPTGDARPQQAVSGKLIALAAVLDVALVLVFAFIGRSSHRLEISVPGVLQSAWPFLAGLAAAWLVFFVFRAPTSLLRGLGVWAVTVAVGQLLRVATGEGAAVAFIIVSIVVLGVFLLGWRLIAAAFRMLARSPRNR